MTDKPKTYKRMIGRKVVVFDTETHLPVSVAKPDFRPSRGDEVEAWLKRQRDKYPKNSSAWFPLDWALDNYRLHADTGTPLSQEINEEMLRGDPGKSFGKE
jgi:hypothetical protein